VGLLLEARQVSARPRQRIALPAPPLYPGLPVRPRSAFQPWLFLAPSLLVLGTFVVLPLLVAVFESVHRWDLLTPRRYVGLRNYEALVAGGQLVDTLGRTLGFGAVVVTLGVGLGLALAVALDRPGRAFAFVRGAVFSAYVVSWILDADAGLLTALVRALGLSPRSWLGDPSVALWSLAGVTVWKITGYAMVIFLAGLQEVPRSLREAAALDGAGPLQRFLHVTWPMLRPTTAFVATTSLILSFQAFDVVRVMTQGGPVKSTTLFVYAIYEQVFLDLRIGRASALVVVFFTVLLALTLLQLWAFRLARRGAAEGAGGARGGGGD
jgi:ABC-type sugar transport system permease subunit